MFDFLKKNKKRMTESRIDVTENGITVTANGIICIKDVPIDDALRIFYALHFVFVDRYVYTVKKTCNKIEPENYIRRDEIEINPDKIECKQFAGDIDVRYDGRLIFSNTESRASDVYLTLRQFIGDDAAQKIIEDPMGDYHITLGN